MNTGFLGPAVATVLTVYGIETSHICHTETSEVFIELQQYLPFTVLKLFIFYTVYIIGWLVATVLTVYGIETVQTSL